MPEIYLNHAADTPADFRVLSQFAQSVALCSGTDSAERVLSTARAEIASLLRVRNCEVVFTSGAGEANNLAVKGIPAANRRKGKHIVTTAREHASVQCALGYMREQGFDVEYVNTDRNGKIDLDHLGKILRQDTVLCAVSAADQRLGTVQPVHDIAELVGAYPNCALHIDAAQAIGRIPFACTAADSVSISAHKLGGLKSAGILCKRAGVTMEPLMHGGFSELYRSGGGDPAAAAACAKALQLSFGEFETRNETVRWLSGFLREKLKALPGITVNSPEDAVPHILNITAAGIPGTELQRLLKVQGVYISADAEEPSAVPSGVLTGLSNAVRISISHMTTQEELAEFASVLERLLREHRPAQ